VAAVDCGTNSIRLLVANLDTERPFGTDLAREMRIVRLGEGVDRTGRLSEAAIERTMTALREYAGLIREHSPEAVRMVATSASRDASNAEDFTRQVKEILGVEPEVVSGDEEAHLSFTGATRELAGADGAPYLVTDIGGGSTELVVGSAHISLNIGCVRITERCLHSDPPTEAEVAEATGIIDAALEEAAAAVPADEARTFVGLAGSVTTIAGVALGLSGYDSARIHHSRVSASHVHAISRQLLTQTRAERAQIPVMHPGRADVIAAGALILDRIMTRFSFTEVLVSEHDILDGIAWSLAK
jgi:exopolyphosphatase/guanosine-5'-triphosphate,3'-diphosphate pyrophosphatase